MPPPLRPQVICAIGKGHSAGAVLDDIPAANCSRDLEVDAVYIRANSSVEDDTSTILHIEPPPVMKFFAPPVVVMV